MAYHYRFIFSLNAFGGADGTGIDECAASIASPLGAGEDGEAQR